MISLLLVIQQFLLSQNERKKKGAEDLSVGREEHKRVQTRALGLGQRSFCLQRAAVNAHKIQRLNDIKY